MAGGWSKVLKKELHFLSEVPVLLVVVCVCVCVCTCVCVYVYMGVLREGVDIRQEAWHGRNCERTNYDCFLFGGKKDS